MAGLRDSAQHSRELYLPELQEGREAAQWSPGRTRSLPQRGRDVGFSIRGADGQSAWKRRAAHRTTAPTETTLRAALLLRCTLLHGLGGVVLAGVLTVVFLESGVRGWLWLILLSMLVVVYGVAAYWCVESLERLSIARWLILGGDLVAMALWWLLSGPSPVLYLLLPGLVLLAASLVSRRGLLLVIWLEAGVLVMLELADVMGVPHLRLGVAAPVSAVFNLVGALACLAWIALALLGPFIWSQQPGRADHRNSAEVARLRIGSDLHLRQLQDGLAALQSTLRQVESGNLHARVAIKEGELATLASLVNSFLDRQERMFDEARQHRQLEAAVSELLALLEALHRGERVGWPTPTGTPVDRILALMRAPFTPRTTAKLPATTAPRGSAPTDAPVSDAHRLGPG